MQREGGNPISYNSEDFALRGAKRYWLHDRIVEPEEKAQGTSKANDNIKSKINALVAGSTFRGKIRFQNLTEGELGLLLWSLKLEANSEVNIGKAKAYGFGRSKIDDVSVKLLDVAKAYDLSGLSLDPFTDRGNGDEFVSQYKREFREKYGRDIDELQSVKALFVMSDASRVPDASRTRYMSIEKREFQNRVSNLIPLPTPQEVVGVKVTPSKPSREEASQALDGQRRASETAEVICATVYKIDVYDNILLKADNKIAMNSRILERDARGLNVKEGDTIRVVFKEDRANSKGKTFHNFRPAR